MKSHMKIALLFVTVVALAIVAKSVWTSSGWVAPSLELDVRFRFSVNADKDLRNES